MQDGRVRTWEINLHPTVGRGHEGSKYRVQDSELRAIHERTKESVHERLREAWVAIDLQDDRVLDVALDAALVAAAVAAPQPGYRSPLVTALRKALRPLKPLLLRHGGPVFRMVAGWLRR
jgi:hypothetical protein